jgi:methylated-DNA-[protein]-cysteine S-methyltransferase
MHMFLLERLETPTGTMLLVTDEAERLRAIDWEEDRLHRLLRRRYGADAVTLKDTPTRSAAAKSVQDYFAGNLTAIDNITCAGQGTPFQEKVWGALRRIPAGATATYGQIAAQIGHPAAVRAVGFANGSNPISIVVPCHRLIGANSSLIKYGGGLARKRWLLMHEGVAVP